MSNKPINLPLYLYYIHWVTIWVSWRPWFAWHEKRGVAALAARRTSHCTRHNGHGVHETWRQCRHTRVTICAISECPLSSVKLQEECQGQNCTVLMILLIKTKVPVSVLFAKSIECSTATRYLGMLYKLNGWKNIDIVPSSKLKTFMFWRAMFYMYQFLYSDG